MSRVWRGFVFWHEYQTLRWEFGLVVWGSGFRAWCGPWSFVLRRVGKQHKVTYPQGARGPRSFPVPTCVHCTKPVNEAGKCHATHPWLAGSRVVSTLGYNGDTSDRPHLVDIGYPPLPRQLPPPPPPPERNPTARLYTPSLAPRNMAPPSQRPPIVSTGRGPVRANGAVLFPPGGGAPIDVLARRHITGAQQVTISGAAVARWGDGLEVMRMFQQPGSKRLMLQIEWQGKKSQVYVGPRVAKLFKVKS